MNRQEVFEKIVTNLYKQDSKSMNKGGLCQYRGNKNKKCAIGFLIPDEKYSHRMEMHGSIEFNSLVISVLEESINFDYEKDSKFLQEIQDWLHDSLTISFFRKNLIDNAFVLAKKYDLETNFMENLK